MNPKMYIVDIKKKEPRGTPCGVCMNPLDPDSCTEKVKADSGSVKYQSDCPPGVSPQQDRSPVPVCTLKSADMNLSSFRIVNCTKFK